MPKLRWCCQSQGCYISKGHVALEIWDDCFPGKIGMSDIDGIVERNGYILILEWKKPQQDIPKGQRLLFEAFTHNSPKHTVLVGRGDYETLFVVDYCWFYAGEQLPWKPCPLGEITPILQQWVNKIESLK